MTADELQRWASILRWIGLTVTTIGVLITFGSHYVADKMIVVQQADKIKAQERLQRTEAELEATKLKTAEIEASQKPRAVTHEQAAALRAAMLRLFSGGLNVPIIVSSKMLDPECEIYARQIAAAIPTTPPISTESQNFTTLGIFPFQGIRIFSDGEQASELVQRVRQAFQDAKIPFSPEHFAANSCPIHPDVGIFIFVGYK
ncbi:MAG TPA: hypothetical protein VHY30_03645 [Verrucomicrobiae bacterium]|jgi:hypothetical protein|nr:hypothetical protein [Verrucomicrobiae bacterium]